jgi:uncharacterized protein
MPSFESLLPTYTASARPEGIAVIGEAVRRVAPESAEFTVEIGASAAGVAQALRDGRGRLENLAQTLAALGVQSADLQTISMNVYNLYAPSHTPLAALGAIPQMPHIPGGMAQMQAGSPISSEVQFGSYHARATLRVTVRDPARVGEIAEAAMRAGGFLSGGFSFKVADEAQARRSALEAAGRDARAKAETLAAAAGKQIGEPVSISEDFVASNGAYAALRAAFPLAFGTAPPHSAGELEYYARVSATFRLQ